MNSPGMDSSDATARPQRIEPRTLRGFRDYLPAQMLVREQLLETARSVYRSYGFSPIDTPALEYEEILSGKGSEETDRQMYRFEDHGGRRVGMRFDLTVPLARFAAQHIGELGTPFKRYHLATVWRGENTQRGRYREFMQCDFDTIGTRSVVADIETGLVIHDLLRALGFTRFQIHVNNRMVLNGLLDKLALRDRSTALLRSLDKLDKIGPAKVQEEMVATAAATEDQARQVLALAEVTGSTDEILSQLDRLVTGSELGERGVANLRDVFRGLAAGGVPPDYARLNVGIARGLDYYTGVIFETLLGDLPGIGSICSGGRYDNLAELFTSQELPGIGASLGLDRLLAAMEELGMVATRQTAAQVLVVYFEERRLETYLQLAAHLRAQGIATELYPEPKKLGHQLRYADRRGFAAAIIAGENELARHEVQLKNLRTGDSQTFPLADSGGLLSAAIVNLLAGSTA